MIETQWNDSGAAPESKTKEQLQGEIARLESIKPDIVNEESSDHNAIIKRIAELKAQLAAMDSPGKVSTTPLANSFDGVKKK